MSGAVVGAASAAKGGLWKAGSSVKSAVGGGAAGGLAGGSPLPGGSDAPAGPTQQSTASSETGSSTVMDNVADELEQAPGVMAAGGGADGPNSPGGRTEYGDPGHEYTEVDAKREAAGEVDGFGRSGDAFWPDDPTEAQREAFEERSESLYLQKDTDITAEDIESQEDWKNLRPEKRLEFQYELFAAQQEGGSVGEAVAGEALKSAVGKEAGAAAGGLIGSALGPVGTAAGAAIGAVAGLGAQKAVERYGDGIAKRLPDSARSTWSGSVDAIRSTGDYIAGGTRNTFDKITGGPGDGTTGDAVDDHDKYQ